MNYLFFYSTDPKKIVRDYSRLEVKGEIVFVHDIFTAYYFAKYSRGYESKQKILLVLHNNGETWNMINIYYPKLLKSVFKFIFNKIENDAIDAATKVGLVSKACKDKFDETHPLYSHKSFFVYNGIQDLSNTLTEKSDSYKYCLCCIGTLSDRKGQLRLIQAFTELPSHIMKDIRITLVGDGVIRPEIEKIIKENKLERQVEIYIGRKDVDTFLRSSNIYILPSNDEGLPISIIEAMRASLGVISTNIAGIPELVEDNKNGLLITPEVSSIKDALMSLSMYDWEEYGRHSRAKYEEQFTIKAMIDNYSSIIMSL